MALRRKERHLRNLALHLLCIVTIIACISILLWGLARVFSFLQPLLVPIAVAGIFAFLLDPLVTLLMRRLKWLRLGSVLAVLGSFLLVATLVLIWLVPVVWEQGGRLISQAPEFIGKARTFAEALLKNYQEKYAGNPLVNELEIELRNRIPELSNAVIGWVQRSLGGVFGAAGFVLSFVLVPVYLFYFLNGAAVIKKRWHEYLPMRSSGFKTEIVSVMGEINDYLVSYFRGQVLISFLNGLLTWIGLQMIGLDFALFIGVLLSVVGLIPFLGIVISAIPALLIALAQGGGGWELPALVILVYAVVQTLDALFITPKIVGDTVGLHPMTVMVSIVFWGLLFDGLIGALLAVPLTATFKVLLKRYIWQKTALVAEESIEISANATSE